jgi:hypothetical protein
MLPDSPDYTFPLNAAGRNSSPSFSGFGGNGTPFSIGYYDGLLGQHGTWTFEISLMSSAEGPWVFHFRVSSWSKPPASSSGIPEAVPASTQEKLVPGLTGVTC